MSGSFRYKSDDEPPPTYTPADTSVHQARGLQLLQTVSELFVKQTSAYTRNRYAIANERGEILFRACEDDDCCGFGNDCLGSERGFRISITDVHENEIIYVQRLTNRINNNGVKVYSPRDVLIGKIIKTTYFLNAKLHVKDAKGKDVLKIDVPASRSGTADFKILSLEDSIQLGKITKHWGGLRRELLTNSDDFTASFPIDFDLHTKALMIAACILIDFLYYGGSR